MRKYVENGGYLTAEAIANVYYAADSLEYSSEWLLNNVHNQIPNKMRLMSRLNLTDTINGIKKHHSSSVYLQELEQALAEKLNTRIQYVDYLPNETFKF